MYIKLDFEVKKLFKTFLQLPMQQSSSLSGPHVLWNVYFHNNLLWTSDPWFSYVIALYLTHKDSND